MTALLWKRRTFLSGAALALLASRTRFIDHAMAGDSGWPRSVNTPKGALALTQKPQRIVSTSVTLTGTLLAINAPVAASSATNNMGTVADHAGFFTQWAEIAHERGVVPVYRTEPDVEAVMAAAPDLIVMSATGGDSALRLYDQISQIAPTLVVNYDDKSWQEVAVLLGEATGLEAEAAAVIADFDKRVANTKSKLRLPPQPTTAAVYYEDDSGANIWTPASAQGKLLLSLGFELATIPPEVKTLTTMGIRSDIIQLSGEQFAYGVNGETLLLFAADDKIIDQVNSNIFLKHIKSVSGKRVYAMGLDTFRLDYYSASHMLERLTRLFA
ncbi:Fe2+-enterobactin ABC transporter substrate-binding protein [Phyllobacterium sp. YR531]|uniref:Fe2+-enterobactin ABC transporter substrate-binding protein n=1 Tax=Phyllobacterium sp. YR531 TaxID=1144343 RepID=UPI00026F5BB2|nr:Fe2+-enterobactin ABC transporter substrate-binding protein [Phyllobacterium sp. YR531]EJM99998.1 ABC-type Fe2+-enterobactin transport system, periplasmic component [Phyllobacterium sp. YR531]